MKFLNKMERKYGKYAIRNLSAYIIALYVAGYIFSYFAPQILNYCYLEPYYILKGQVWRLVSWILIPPGKLDFFTIIMLFFYYSVGTALEQRWGAFRYNVYIFSGIIFTAIGAFILYFIMGSNTVFGIFNSFSTYYINLSIFLAFAASYPDATVLLYFFIPLKMKWLGLFYGVMVLLSFVSSTWVGKVVILASLANFLVFFLSTRNMKQYSYKEQKRKMEYRKQTQRPSGTGNGTASGKSGVVTRHKCAVCGRTELDGDDLEFRFCSKCDGNYEYCQDHLFTHTHVH